MKLNNFELAFVLGRLLLGLTYLMHGVVRIPKQPAFTNHLLQQFAATPLPPALVSAFGTALPFAEAAIGLLLVLGLFTRAALVGAMLVLMGLVFGSCLLENWALVGDQLLYGLFIITLVLHLGRNRLCLDAVSPPGPATPGSPPIPAP